MLCSKAAISDGVNRLPLFLSCTLAVSLKDDYLDYPREPFLYMKSSLELFLPSGDRLSLMLPLHSSSIESARAYINSSLALLKAEGPELRS